MQNSIGFWPLTMHHVNVTLQNRSAPMTAHLSVTDMLASAIQYRTDVLIVHGLYCFKSNKSKM